MVDNEMENKNYLLIGAANGMGATLACDLAECKANLFLIDVDEKLKTLCARLSAKTKCEGYICDLRNYAKVADYLKEKMGDKGFDGIVYFTRGRQTYDYVDLDESKWKDDLRLNVESLTYILHQLWVKKLINKNASIVFLTSVCTKYGGPQSLSYIMSKAALESMCRCLAVEMGPSNIRVNTLQLGFIVKDEHKERFYSKDNHDYRFWAQRVHPLRRVGHDEDVIGPIKFLLSKWASFITGQIICVDGGLTIQEPSSLVKNFMNAKNESHDAKE